MPEFNWPPKDTDIEALVLERGPKAPARQRDAATSLTATESIAGATVAAAQRRRPALDDMLLRARSPLDSARIERPPDPLTGANRKATAASNVAPPRRARADSRHWRRLANRLVLPVLVAVVVIESAWLAIGGFKNPFARAVETVPAAAGVDRPAPAAPQPAVAADVVTWQAAVAGNAAALGTLSQPSPSTGAAVGANTAEPPPVAAPGFVAISLPFQVEVYENDRFVGLNGTGIPLSAGSHRLTLVNESLQYRATQSVSVVSGRTTNLPVALPTGMLQLNASPWAEVLIDGKSIGETPLGNVRVPIGPHTIVFRHPELGEQTRSVVVLSQSSTRLVVNLQK